MIRGTGAGNGGDGIVMHFLVQLQNCRREGCSRASAIGCSSASFMKWLGHEVSVVIMGNL